MSESMPTPRAPGGILEHCMQFKNVMLSTSRVWMHAWMPKRSMRRMVMSTYGCDTSSSLMRMVMPSCPFARGAAISSAVRYWLLTAPLSSTCDRGSLSQCKLQSSVQGPLASDGKPRDQALCNAACKSMHSAWVQV